MSEPGYNFTNFQEDAAHPFTGRTDAQGNFTGYNPVGLALLTGGTGLITWVLARMLGMKSGASLTASILGSLAMAHIATGKQRYGDAFDPMKVDQWKEMFNKMTEHKPTYEEQIMEDELAENERAAKEIDKENAEIAKQQQAYQDNKKMVNAASKNPEINSYINENTSDTDLNLYIENGSPEQQAAAMRVINNRLKKQKQEQTSTEYTVNPESTPVIVPNPTTNSLVDPDPRNRLAAVEEAANRPIAGETTPAPQPQQPKPELKPAVTAIEGKGTPQDKPAVAPIKNVNTPKVQVPTQPIATPNTPAPQVKPKVVPPQASPTSVTATNSKPQAVSGPQAAHNAFIDKNFPGARQDPEMWKQINEAIEMSHPRFPVKNPYVTPGGTIIY